MPDEAAQNLIEAWKLNFNIGMVIALIRRAGDKSTHIPSLSERHKMKIEDFKLARYHLDREIAQLEAPE